MYKMNTRMLLAIVATTAILTMMTSSIEVGIFSQHANATPCSLTGVPPSFRANGQGATQFHGGPSSPLNCEGNTCSITQLGSNPPITTSEMHAVITPSGQTSLSCHS